MLAEKPPSDIAGKTMSKKTGDQFARKRKRIDWPAIRRDWRTSKFTQAELAAKYEIDPATLNRQIKKDQKADPAAWPQDLTEAIRQATDARLMAEMVKTEINEGQEQVKNNVKIAAEVNAQVILSHRTRATKAVDVALRMLGELDATTTHAESLAELFEKITEDTEGPALAAAQQRFSDLMKLHNRVGSVHKLLDALAKAQAMERQSHNISDGESADEKSRRTIPIVFVDAGPQQPE